jgi:hypothetical protein
MKFNLIFIFLSIFTGFIFSEEDHDFLYVDPYHNVKTLFHIENTKGLNETVTQSIIDSIIERFTCSRLNTSDDCSMSVVSIFYPFIIIMLSCLVNTALCVQGRVFFILSLLL